MEKNILAHMGFEPEFMGGGCYLLTRYLPNGACVAVSAGDGACLPTHDDWLVCGYANGEIGSPSFDCSFSGDTAAALDQSINTALDIVGNGLGETCRNGRPWAQCDCC